MVEIEIPNLQDWRNSSDGPLHVVFIVHLVSTDLFYHLASYFTGKLNFEGKLKCDICCQKCMINPFETFHMAFDATKK